MPLKLGIIVESSMIVTSYMWMPNVKLRFLCFEVYHSLAVCYSILPIGLEIYVSYCLSQVLFISIPTKHFELKNNTSFTIICCYIYIDQTK